MGHTSASQRMEMDYEYWKNRFCSTDGLRPIVRVSSMRRTLQRQLQGQELFLPGSIPLHGFCAADLPGKSAGYPGILRDSGEEQLRFQTPVLPTGGQIDWGTSRPDHYRHRFLHAERLPRQTATHLLPRCRNEQASGLSDQQLHAPRAGDCSTLQMPLASRALLQMDQAAPADQSILWDHRERGQNTNLDRHLRVCPGRHFQEASE